MLNDCNEKTKEKESEKRKKKRFFRAIFYIAVVRLILFTTTSISASVSRTT